MCVWPHSTSRTFVYFIHVLCMAHIQEAVPLFLPSMLCAAHIQPAVPFSIPSMLRVWPPFNQPYRSLVQPCCVYGPIQPAAPFSFIHAVCTAPFNQLHLFLPSMLCVRSHSTSCTFFFHPCCVYGPIQPAAPFSSIHAVCTAPFNQLHHFLPSMLCVRSHSTSCTFFFHPCCVYGPRLTSRTFLSAIHLVCTALNQPVVPSLFHPCCVYVPIQPSVPFFHPCCVYGPHSSSRTFISSIHVLCVAPVQPAATFSLPSMLCLLPQSTSRTLPSSKHVVCGPIQPAAPFSLRSMLRVGFPFNQPHLPLFHLCSGCGPIRAAVPFSLQSMLCALPNHSAIPLPLPTMLCVQLYSTSRTLLSSSHVVCMVHIQPVAPFSFPSMCVWPPFNQLYLSLFHPCHVYGPHSTSRTFLFSINIVCMAPIQPAVPFLSSIHVLCMCNGGYFSETSLRSRIPPARPRDPVIHIKPQAPKARGYCDCCRCLIRIQVGNKEQSLSPEPRLNGEC